MVKSYTLFKIQNLETHTPLSGTYPFRPNKGPHPAFHPDNGTADLGRQKHPCVT